MLQENPADIVDDDFPVFTIQAFSVNNLPNSISLTSLTAITHRTAGEPLFYFAEPAQAFNRTQYVSDTEQVTVYINLI
jgi:hypothetical protein